PSGSLLQLRGQRREELEARGTELAAEPELSRRADEERLCLGGVEPREVRPVPACETVPTRRAPDRHDGNTHHRQCLRVALNRPLRDLEPLGELDGGELAARLQQEQKRDEPACAHSFERSALTRQKMAGM